MKSNTKETAKLSKLRAWREANDLTLDDESGLSGYSVPFLSRLERGQRNLRPLDRVRFARALGASVGELFEPEPGGTKP